MINTITTLSSPNEWINICEIKSFKTYILTLSSEDILSLTIHIHDKEGNCLKSIGMPGGALMSGFDYKYTIAGQDGFLALRINKGKIKNICVEEKV